MSIVEEIKNIVAGLGTPAPRKRNYVNAPRRLKATIWKPLRDVMPGIVQQNTLRGTAPTKLRQGLTMAKDSAAEAHYHFYSDGSLRRDPPKVKMDRQGRKQAKRLRRAS